MPNWTENYLRMHKSVAPKYLTEGRFDFNKIIPMPEIYTEENADAPYGPYCAGSNTGESVIIYLTGGFTCGLDDETLRLAVTSVRGMWGWDSMPELVDRAEKLYASYKSPKEKAKLIESGRLRVEAVQRYGAPDWYEWAYRNWGTKWNARDTEIVDKGDGTVEIRFATAWGYPFGIVDALAQCETNWSWEFEDEDYTGVYVITPDHLNPERIPGTEPKEPDDE